MEWGGHGGSQQAPPRVGTFHHQKAWPVLAAAANLELRSLSWLLDKSLGHSVLANRMKRAQLPLSTEAALGFFRAGAQARMGVHLIISTVPTCEYSQVVKKVSFQVIWLVIKSPVSQRDG